MRAVESGEKTPRQSNIELLRIAAMVMIVAHHFAVHGGFDFPSDAITLNRLWIQFIQIGGKIGVNVFVLISGYFLVPAESIKTSRIVRLWGQIFFYSMLVFVVFIAVGIRSYSTKELIRHLAPLTSSQWWFASAYFILYLLSPYINRLLKTFDKKQFTAFLALLLTCWCVIPTITGKQLQSNDLLWFVVLYCLAGYYRLFGIKAKSSAAKLIGLSVVCTVLTFLSAVAYDILGLKWPWFSENATILYDMQKLPMLIVAMLLFKGFLKLNIRYNKLVNTIASSTFGIYLIHDNVYVREYLWPVLFRNASYAERKMLIPHSLIAIAATFIVCSAIEMARIYLIEKRCLPVINRVSGYIDKISDSILTSRIMKRLDR